MEQEQPDVQSLETQLKRRRMEQLDVQSLVPASQGCNSNPNPNPEVGCNPKPDPNPEVEEYLQRLRRWKPTGSFYGPLGGDTPPLPRDAWNKWCKHGSVICFAVEAAYPVSSLPKNLPKYYRVADMLKIYFGNPMDGSIYHVIDFDYFKYGRNPFADDSKVGFILVGSRIYVLGGVYSRQIGPVDVYYCDVDVAAAANGNDKALT